MDERVGAPAKELLAWSANLRERAQEVLAAVGELDRGVHEAIGELERETTERDGSEPRQKRYDLDPGSAATADLVTALRRHERVRATTAPTVERAKQLVGPLTELESNASRAQGRLRMRFSSAAKREATQEALDQLTACRAWAEQHAVSSDLTDATHVASEPLDADSVDAWADVERRIDWYAAQLMASSGKGAVVLESEQLAKAVQLAVQLPAIADATTTAVGRVKARFEAVRREMVRETLVEMPIARVKEVTSGRVRLGTLERGGYRTIQSVLDSSPHTLMSLDGIGETTANQVYAAARQLAKAVEDDLRFRIDLDPTNPVTTELVIGLCEWDRLNQVTVGLDPDDLADIGRQLTAVASMRPTGRGYVVFEGSDDSRRVAEAVKTSVTWADTTGGFARLEKAGAVLSGTGITAEEAWADFTRRSADYYTLLGTVVDLNLDEEAEVGFLPTEIVEKVHAHPLDESLRRVSLRGYQSFGARFALVQKRVIIGDEMGLGKTIQAIAALAHLTAIDAPGRLLVVCPASVLVNWTREISQRSLLRVHRMHGPDRDHAVKQWKKAGGVGVTTFATLRAIDLGRADFAMVVVDEAHFLKNPATQRSRNVLRLLARSDRALFLTGTPMENRVDEFKTLVNFLQPWLVENLVHGTYVAPDRFRQQVAPAYLRRNQEDVLAELPQLVITDEWEDFSPGDLRAYRRAVTAGNFMAMRRAAFDNPASSTKLARLREIVAEAGENGHKTIVFSYFRDVLDLIRAELGAVAHGPLTGSVSASKRQQLVDRFSDAKGDAVLLSQIQAGGVGLNMQAGSVVVICEPQVKPTLEAQAIARAHRMGQVRGVQVHRLLTTDSIDQRMVEILNSKQALFDEYARRSDIANASPEAFDVSEASLAKTIIEEEQERLALKAVEQFRANQTAESSEV